MVVEDDKEGVVAKNSKMKCSLFFENFFFSNFGAIGEVKMILEVSMKDGV